ncbi:MAG TPA: hypothetical protein VHY09_15250 [Candidatus Methylacidiphilales bacterium]|nr:hypothetical protein [Candidatus Methylacidiphilales bacterium]
MNRERVLFFSACWLVVSAACMWWLATWYDDIRPDLGDAPPSILENAGHAVCLVVLFPLVLEALVPDSVPAWIVLLSTPILWLLTGLFWGCITEGLLLLFRHLGIQRT